MINQEHEPITIEARDVWQLRHDLASAIRIFFASRNYIEVQTPAIVVMPGTEVHLDYFETSWIDYQNRLHRRYLRSSPELHMKQILTQGCDRIYQLGSSFRNNGEKSQWHNPEFTLLEWYRCNIGFDDFLCETEELLRFTHNYMKTKWPKVVTWHFPQRIRRYSLAEAFRQFVGIELIDEDQDLASRARLAGVQSVRASDDFETSFFKILIEKIEPALENDVLSVLVDYPASQAALSRIEGGVAKRFEFYAGRTELCNAFFELVDAHENRDRLEKTTADRASLGKQNVEIDHSYLEAVNQGLPESCGNALGFDRWLAVLCSQPSLTSILPFHHVFEDASMT